MFRANDKGKVAVKIPKLCTTTKLTREKLLLDKFVSLSSHSYGVFSPACLCLVCVRDTSIKDTLKVAQKIVFIIRKTFVHAGNKT